MSEQEQVQSDQTEQVAPKEVVQDEIVVNRSAEEYAVRLKDVTAEAKANRKKAAEYKKQLDDLERGKMAEQGQYKELADQWKAKALESDERTEKMQSQIAYNAVTSRISNEAIKMGCVDTDALVQIMDLSEVPIDENFKVDGESVKLMLENVKKEKSYFFSKAAPSVKDGVPVADVNKQTTNLKNLSIDELSMMLAKKNKG